MGNTARGAPFPELTDPPNGPADVQALAVYVDFMPGIATQTYAQINAMAGAALWAGRHVYQTDTGTARPVSGLYEYNGVNWRLPWTQPWGPVPGGRGVLGGNQTNSDAAEHAIGGGWEPVITAVANRLYRISLSGAWRQLTTGNVGFQIKIKDGTTLIEDPRTYSTPQNVDVPVAFSVETTLTAGSHQINVTQQAAGSSGVECIGANAPLVVTVDDVGPSGTPT